MNVKRTKIDRRCCDGGRWRYTAALDNVTLRQWLTTCNDVAMANSVLQLATLWQWLVARGATMMVGNLRCCGNGR